MWEEWLVCAAHARDARARARAPDAGCVAWRGRASGDGVRWRWECKWAHLPCNKRMAVRRGSPALNEWVQEDGSE